MPSLPAGNYLPSSISLIDRTEETGVFRVYGRVITAANFDAQATLWTALTAAANALTIGSVVKTVHGVEVVYASVIPTDNAAQRENKLLIRAQTASGIKATYTLPTVDLQLLTFLTGAKDFCATTTEQGATEEVTDFIEAFEAFAVEPRSGTVAMAVRSLQFVGRNT